MNGFFGSYLGPNPGGMIGNAAGAYQPPSKAAILAAMFNDLGMAMQGQPGTHLPQLQYTQQLALKNQLKREELERKRKQEEEWHAARMTTFSYDQADRLKKLEAERRAREQGAKIYVEPPPAAAPWLDVGGRTLTTEDGVITSDQVATESWSALGPGGKKAVIDPATNLPTRNWIDAQGNITPMSDEEWAQVQEGVQAAPISGIAPAVATPSQPSDYVTTLQNQIGTLQGRIERTRPLAATGDPAEVERLERFESELVGLQGKLEEATRQERTGPVSYDTVDPESGVARRFIYKPESPDANELGYVDVGVAPRSAGTELSVDPETGAISYKQGGPAGQTRTTQTKEQERVYRTARDLAQLDRARMAVKEEHFQAIPKLKNRAMELMTQFGVKELTPEQFESIAGESEAGAAITAYTSQIRHELYGAQLTTNELRESLKELPGFGYEFWQGGSYPRFIGKMRAAEKKLKLASARSIIAEGLGGDWKDFAKYGLNVGSIDALAERWRAMLVEQFKSGGDSAEEAEINALQVLTDKLGHLLVEE